VRQHGRSYCFFPVAHLLFKFPNLGYERTVLGQFFAPLCNIRVSAFVDVEYAHLKLKRNFFFLRKAKRAYPRERI